MYESKYSKYLTHNTVRFAEEKEITSGLSDLEDRAGVPLYSKDGRVYIDASDNHTVVVGPTGCKKSRLTVMTTVASVINSGESAVVNDPKGEIYANTASLAKRRNADVFVLNLRDTRKSNSWNPLYQAYEKYHLSQPDEAMQYINDFAETLVAPALKCTVDKYWGDCAKQLLTSLSLMLIDSVPLNYCNIANLIQLCYEENCATLKNLLSKMDQQSTAAFGLHTVVDLEAEKTKSCIYSTLMAILTPFLQNSGLLKLLSGNSIKLDELGKKQTIVYLIYPDEKNSLNFIVNMFLTQCYEVLVNEAAKNDDDKLKIRVNFVLDEFSNLAAIDNFENRISEARSKNIRYFLYIQSYSQLEQKYKENAETMISNCNNWVCFGSKEMKFLNKVSEICGKETDYNGIEHPLISASNIQYLKKGKEYSEVLILRQGMYPYVAELPDYSILKLFKDVSRADLKNIEDDSKAEFFTFSVWISGIERDKFRYPFHYQRALAQDDNADLKST